MRAGAGSRLGVAARRALLLASLLAASLFASLFAPGCRYSAEIPRCTVRCGTMNACPSGTTCNAQDGFCHPTGDAVACTGGAGTGGTSGTGGGPGADGGGGRGGAGDGGPAGCQLGERRCAGDVPQMCAANGQWLDQTACGGATPICNDGTCGPFRLRGAVNTVGVRAQAGAIRLREEKLDLATRTCSGSVCISGGLTP